MTLFISLLFISTMSGTVPAASQTAYINQDLYSSQYQAAVNTLNNGGIAESFPELMRFAQYGEKFAQFAVGGLMVAGDGTEQNVLEGLAWMNLATEQRTTVWISRVDAIMAQLSEDHRKLVQDRTEQFRAMYGIEAQNMRCRRERETGSNLSNHVCTKYTTREGQYPVIVFNN